MGKRDLENVTLDLSALAAPLPTQKPPMLKVVPAPSQEGQIQFSPSVRKELARLAADADMTMRAFVLNALKEKGLSVREDDLADLRKERPPRKY